MTKQRGLFRSWRSRFFRSWRGWFFRSWRDWLFGRWLNRLGRSRLDRFGRSRLNRFGRSGLNRLGGSGLDRLSWSGLDRLGRSGLNRLGRSRLNRLSWSGLDRLGRSGLNGLDRSSLNRLGWSRFNGLGWSGRYCLFRRRLNIILLSIRLSTPTAPRRRLNDRDIFAGLRVDVKGAESRPFKREPAPARFARFFLFGRRDIDPLGKTERYAYRPFGRFDVNINSQSRQPVLDGAFCHNALDRIRRQDRFLLRVDHAHDVFKGPVRQRNAPRIVLVLQPERQLLLIAAAPVVDASVRLRIDALRAQERANAQGS